MFEILVVEDDRDLNRSVCSYLNQNGYQATGCLSAEEAYDAMYGTVFDCIVSDIMMPGIDGFEFVKTVRSLNETIPVLFMTARDDFAAKQRGYRMGIDDYMVKPIDLDELLLRIGALLRRAKIASSRKLEVGSFSMDADEHTAILGDEDFLLGRRAIYNVFDFYGNHDKIASKNILNYIINSSVTLITKLITSIITTFTAVVFSIYILSQKEEVINGTKKLIKAYLPKATSTRIIEIGSLTNQTFTKFISGQCVDAVFLGIIMFIAFTIFRFPYALLIAVLTTITALIPIFGALIAMVIGALLIATESPIQALIFIAVFQIIQQIEGNFIYPRVVGKSVGLSPMWTLVAITIGGSLFGILGMLTFLPLASVCYAIFKDDIIKRLNTAKEK